MPPRIDMVTGRPPQKGYETQIAEKSLAEGSKMATEAKQDTIIARLGAIAGLVTTAYDYFSITRNASNFITSIVFKTGGSGGTTVATITIARDASNFVTSITKT